MASELEVHKITTGAGSGGNDPTLIVGGTGNAQLKVRHIDGKQSYNADMGSLYLNQYSTGDVVMCSGGGVVKASNGITVSGGFLSLDTPTELTIASGAVTVTKSFHDIDTEGDAATDDLDTINGGSAGDILTLKTVTGSRDVTVKDATGNLRLAGDFTLTSPNDTITLIKYSTVWIETSRSDNV